MHRGDPVICARPPQNPAHRHPLTRPNPNSRQKERLTRARGRGAMVTDSLPATLPAKVTVPETGARTNPAGAEARSTPQWPPP